MLVVFEENRVEDHCIKMSGLVEKRATSATCMLNGIGQTYVTEFELTGINYIVKTNNYNAAREFSVAEANVRRWNAKTQKLINANSTQKYFSGPKHGHFQDSEN
jgi:hypothetical protein